MNFIENDLMHGYNLMQAFRAPHRKEWKECNALNAPRILWLSCAGYIDKTGFQQAEKSIIYGLE